MGQVFLAEDLKLQRRAALKLISPTLTRDETRRVFVRPHAVHRELSVRVNALEPLVFAGIPVLLTAVAMLAVWVPRSGRDEWIRRSRCGVSDRSRWR